MNSARYPLLAREGWVHSIAVGSVALVVHYYVGALAAAPLWLAVVLVLQFFRDPPRMIPAAPRAVLCPADGTVITLGEAEDPYLKRPALRISIFMSPFNVHSNRMPVDGEIMEAWYHEGKFFNAALEKASEANERNALWVRTERGQEIVVVQVAGFIARRILCYVRPGERVGRGQRYGFIRFGSRVDLYLPPEVRPRVALGDKVKGGTDIIAEFVN